MSRRRPKRTVKRRPIPRLLRPCFTVTGIAKYRFVTEEEAINGVNQVEKCDNSQHVYKCPVCDFWHRATTKEKEQA